MVVKFFFFAYYLIRQVFLSQTDYRSSVGSGVVILDDCNFHESVRLDSFEADKTLALVSETKII